MNEEVVAFYDAVAHDLRNPLNTLTMTLALLQRSGTSPEMLARAQRAMDRLKRMHEQLVGLGRVRGGGLELRRQPATVDDVCRRALAEVDAGDVTLESAGSIPGSWDIDLLVRAVAEVVRNAVQHGGGGTIRIGVGERLKISVESPAPVEPDVRPHLFDPVARRVAMGKKAASGLGLGLYLARAYVEAHGGTLNATAVEGPTRFELELPR